MTLDGNQNGLSMQKAEVEWNLRSGFMVDTERERQKREREREGGEREGEGERVMIHTS